MRSFSRYLTEQTKPKFSSSEFDVPGVTIKRNKYLDAPAPSITGDQIRQAQTSAIERQFQQGNLGAAQRQQMLKKGAGLATVQQAAASNVEARKRTDAIRDRMKREAEIRASNKAAYAAADARAREMQQDAIKRLAADDKAKSGVRAFTNLFSKVKNKELPAAERSRLELLAKGPEGLDRGEVIPDYSLETLIPGGAALRGINIASKVAPRVTSGLAATGATALGTTQAAKDVTREVQRQSDKAWEAQQTASKGLAAALTFGQADTASDIPAPKIKFRDVVGGVYDSLKSGQVTPSELTKLGQDPTVQTTAASAAMQGILNTAAPGVGYISQTDQFARGNQQIRQAIASNIVPQRVDPNDPTHRQNMATGARILGSIQQSAIRREQK